MGSEWLLEALRTSETLEVDDKGENIRRRTEVKEPKGQFERSIYAVCEYSTSVLEPVLTRFAERVWKGRARLATEIRKIFQHLWEIQCCSNAAEHRYERVQSSFPNRIPARAC